MMDTDPNTNDAKNITNTHNNTDDFNPDWSPNGKKIAFQRYQGGDYDIFVMNSDGSRQKNRTNNSSPVDDIHPIVP